MSGKVSEDGVDSATEARDLIHDAKEAKAHGDKEEADFLVDAAKELDPKAAKDELKKND